jgi:hypothetical protein
VRLRQQLTKRRRFHTYLYSSRNFSLSSCPCTFELLPIPLVTTTIPLDSRSSEIRAVDGARLDKMAPVQLYVYDLSRGMAKQMSLMLTGKQIDGIW